LTVARIVDATKGRRPDVIIGGPPCQGFSTLGDRLSADPRNVLVDAFIRIVDALRPQAVILENVRAIATEYQGRYKNYVLKKFEEIGYGMHFSVLNAADYGVPQHRRRAFFVGFADRHVAYAFPKPSHGKGLLPYATVGDAIMDLADKGPEIPNHVPLDHSKKVVTRYALIPEGGMLPPAHELPPEIRRQNFGSTYKRLNRAAPSLTIVPGKQRAACAPVLYIGASLHAKPQGCRHSRMITSSRETAAASASWLVMRCHHLLAHVLAKSIWDRILPLKGHSATVQTRVWTPKASARRKHVRRPTWLHAPISKDAPGFVDLFSGAGGFTIGFSMAGFRPLVSADMSGKVRDMHALNYPDVPFVLGDLSFPEVQAQIADLVGPDPCMVVGGPPCQGFSVFGHRRLARRAGTDARHDPRNRLVFSFVDTVSRVNPRWVLMENVPGFASLDGGAFVKLVARSFKGWVMAGLNTEYLMPPTMGCHSEGSDSFFWRIVRAT
jgi:DNA (cytosine-5)-methyltransferase 1